MTLHQSNMTFFVCPCGEAISLRMAAMPAHVPHNTPVWLVHQGSSMFPQAGSMM